MRVPVPRNKLVAFTLAGAVLTAVLAVGLAYPGLGLSDGTDAAPPADTDSGAIAATAADAPTPNSDFTPAVQPSSSDGEEEDHEFEEYEEHEEYDDDDEHDEYEEEHEEYEDE